MIKKITTLTPEEIKRDAEQALNTPIVATQGQMEALSDIPNELHEEKSPQIYIDGDDIED